MDRYWTMFRHFIILYGHLFPFEATSNNHVDPDYECIIERSVEWLLFHYGHSTTLVTHSANRHVLVNIAFNVYRMKLSFTRLIGTIHCINKWYLHLAAEECCQVYPPVSNFLQHLLATRRRDVMHVSSKKRRSSVTENPSLVTIIKEEKCGVITIIGVSLGLATILSIAITAYVISGKNHLETIRYYNFIIKRNFQNHSHVETPLLQLQRMATWLMISPVPLGSVVIISSLSLSWTWTFRFWSLMYDIVRLTALHPTGVQRDTGIASSHSVHNNSVAVWSMWEEKGGLSTLLWWRFAQEDCGAQIDFWNVCNVWRKSK